MNIVDRAVLHCWWPAIALTRAVDMLTGEVSHLSQALTQRQDLPRQLESVLVAARAWAAAYGADDDGLFQVTTWALLEAVEELERGTACM